MVTLERGFTLCLARDSAGNGWSLCHMKGQGIGLPALQPGSSASPTGSGGCWQRWPRASNEEKGESTWKKVVWVFSDRETCETRSAWAYWEHIRCKSRNPHPQPPDLETLGLFPRMNTSSLFWILLFVLQPLAFPWHAARSHCQGAPALFCKVRFLAPPIKPALWSLRKPMALMVVPQVLPSLSVLRNSSYRELNHQ